MTIQSLENITIINQQAHSVNSTFDKFPQIDKSKSLIATFQRTVGGNEHTLLLENQADMRQLWEFASHIMSSDIKWRIAQINFDKTKKNIINNLNNLI